MKITVVTYYLPPVDRIGSGVQMHMLANAYADLGHDVTVLAPSSEKDTTARYRLDTIPVSGPWRVLKWSLALAKYNFDADMVHFGGDDHFVPFRRHYAHVRTFHGSCFAEARVASHMRDRVRMTFLGITELLTQRNFKACVAVSEHTNRFFIRPNPVIPNGVDLTAFVPSVNKSDIPSILFLGTLDSRKRGRMLLEAFSNQVIKQLPNAELWIVRDNTPIDMPGVRVFGSVPQDKLIELYKKAWVFCLPSSYEGFGVPYIESMACGTPVIATPNAGSLEVLDRGKYGIITDVADLGTSIVSLLGDSCRQEQLRAIGIERVRQYDIHKIAQRYISMATELITTRNSG